jgi:hypothetical protein
LTEQQPKSTRKLWRQQWFPAGNGFGADSLWHQYLFERAYGIWHRLFSFGISQLVGWQQLRLSALAISG